MKKKKHKPEVNLIELIPERIVDHEVGDDSIVTVLKPRFTGKFAMKFLEPRMKVKTFKIDLDRIGSAVWVLCDGKRNVGEIGCMMQEEFGEDIEPCFDRLALFFAHLEASEFIRYSNLDALNKRS